MTQRPLLGTQHARRNGWSTKQPVVILTVSIGALTSPTCGFAKTTVQAQRRSSRDSRDRCRAARCLAGSASRVRCATCLEGRLVQSTGGRRGLRDKRRIDPPSDPTIDNQSSHGIGCPVHWPAPRTVRRRPATRR